jgi:hypothetical protein
LTVILNVSEGSQSKLREGSGVKINHCNPLTELAYFNNAAAGGELMKRMTIGCFVVTFFLTGTQSFAQTQEQLVAGAKKEGKLVVYASATAPQLQMYFATFNKRYPFIKTEFFRTGKQKLVSKILFEEQAKQHIADIIHTSVIETNILKKRGALSRHVPNEAASYPSQYKDPEVFGPRPMPAELF